MSKGQGTEYWATRTSLKKGADLDTLEW